MDTFRFWAPFGLIVKLLVDFLFVLIELFARCHGSGATSEYWLQIGVFQGTRLVSPKFSRRMVAPQQPFMHN